jgi:hypothetical protein
MNAESLKNLRPPWKPGETGNPKGPGSAAHKGKRLTTLLNELIDREIPTIDPITKEKEFKTLREVIVLNLLAAASNPQSRNKLQSAKEIFDRLDGTPINTTKLVGDNLKIKIEVEEIK